MVQYDCTEGKQGVANTCTAPDISIKYNTSIARVTKFHSGKTRCPCLEEGAVERLGRIEGQVKGIKRMAAEEKECEDILVQIKAVQSALQRASLLLLYEHMDTCVSGAIESGNGAAALADLKEALDKIV